MKNNIRGEDSTHFAVSPQSFLLSWLRVSPSPPSPARLCTGGSSPPQLQRTCSTQRSRRGGEKRWSKQDAIHCSFALVACPDQQRPSHGTLCRPNRPLRKGQRETWELGPGCQSCTSDWSSGSLCDLGILSCWWCSAIPLQVPHSRRRGPWTTELPGCRIW